MAYLIGICFFVLGTILASFTAVLAERLYTGQSWMTGRSRCNSCGEALGVQDLIPVFSWLYRRGRARCCRSRVPAAYAIGELTLGAIFTLSFFTIGLSLLLIPFLLAVTVLAFIVMYDLRHTVVPSFASILLIIFSGAYATVRSGVTEHLGLTLMVAGVIALGFFMLFFFSRGRAMGLGDAPVALALALLTGPSLAIAGLLFSFWIGAVIGIGILVSSPKGHRMGIEVPFVPFLAAGYLLAFFTQWNPLLFTF